MDRPTPESLVVRSRAVLGECGMGQTSEQYIAELRLLLNQTVTALSELKDEIEDLRAASQLALDCHYHDEPTCQCWIASARAAAQGGK